MEAKIVISHKFNNMFEFETTKISCTNFLKVTTETAKNCIIMTFIYQFFGKVLIVIYLKDPPKSTSTNNLNII